MVFPAYILSFISSFFKINLPFFVFLYIFTTRENIFFHFYLFLFNIYWGIRQSTGSTPCSSKKAFVLLNGLLPKKPR